MKVFKIQNQKIIAGITKITVQKTTLEVESIPIPVAEERMKAMVERGIVVKILICLPNSPLILKARQKEIPNIGEMMNLITTHMRSVEISQATIEFDSKKEPIPRSEKTMTKSPTYFDRRSKNIGVFNVVQDQIKPKKAPTSNGVLQDFQIATPMS